MKLVKERVVEATGNSQRLYRCDNGYGASVVQGPYTYGGPEGKFELAVIKWNSDDVEDFDLVYDTPITSDVIGWLEEEEVQTYLKQIDAL